MRPHFLAKAAAAIILLSGTGAALAEPQNRCGWVVNPTPGNYWLTDKDATWIMLSQGTDADLPGMDLIGDISEHDYVATNGNYGYACGCMKVDTDAAQSRITAIYSFRQLKLAKCQKDPSLPAPE